jgi:hypothetical protein
MQRLYQDPHSHAPIWLKVSSPKSLRDSRNETRSIGEVSLDGWFVMDADGRILGQSIKYIRFMHFLRSLLLALYGDRVNKSEYVVGRWVINGRDKRIGRFDDDGDAWSVVK